MSEKHILHIEDNFHNRRIVRKILEKQGYKLHEAADGVIGYNMIQEMKPPMVLLDISLPGMDGIEIAEKVKADDDLKHIIMIAVTASAMQGDRERFLAAGCDDYLSKPFRSIDLLDLVNQYYAQIPESYMTSFKPKDMIHPIEEHSVLAEPESRVEAKLAHEETPEPFTPIKEETPAETERGFFAREEEEPQAEETASESMESLQDSGLLKTASLEGLLTDEELDKYLEDESPVEEEIEEVEEAPEPIPATALAGEAESEEEDDDETITWVMPRNGMDNLPGEEERPMEELPAEPAEPLEDEGVTYNTFLEEISREDALDESSMEETPEPAASAESEAATAETLPEGVEMQTETSEDESEETAQVWRPPDQTEELVLDTDFLQPSVLEEAPEEDEVETAPELVSPTEVVEKLMSFTGEEPVVETEPDLEGVSATEPMTEPEGEVLIESAASMDEVETIRMDAGEEWGVEKELEGEDVLTTEPASETEEETITEPAASLDDEIETLRMDAGEEWELEKEIEAEEEATPEPAVSPDKMATTALEAEEVLAEEPAPEAEEEALTEPAASLYDEIETIRMDTGEEWDVEKELEAEATEAPQETAARSRLDETSPLKEQVLEASMVEEPRPESPSNGSGREDQSEKKESREKESPKKNELTDQVVQMINPKMIRPVDPNVGLEGG